MAAPSVWQSASQTFSSLPSWLWTAVDAQLDVLLAPGGLSFRLELVVCLEILNGPGSMTTKLQHLQSVLWHF
eukprot:1307139-Rhodomonas_salina.5